MRGAGLTSAAERGWDRIFDDLIADFRTAIAGMEAPDATQDAVAV